MGTRWYVSVLLFGIWILTQLWGFIRRCDLAPQGHCGPRICEPEKQAQLPNTLAPRTDIQTPVYVLYSESLTPFSKNFLIFYSAAPTLAVQHYHAMNVKQVQNDTLSHFILARASTFSLAASGDIGFTQECIEASNIYVTNSADVSVVSILRAKLSTNFIYDRLRNTSSEPLLWRSTRRYNILVASVAT